MPGSFVPTERRLSKQNSTTSTTERSFMVGTPPSRDTSDAPEMAAVVVTTFSTPARNQ